MVEERGRQRGEVGRGRGRRTGCGTDEGQADAKGRSAERQPEGQSEELKEGQPKV